MKICDINPFIRYISMSNHRVINDWVKTYDHRLFYILDGECELSVEDKCFELSRHTLIMLRSGTPYRFDSAHAVEMIVINFDMTLGHAKKKEVLRPLSVTEFEENKILEPALFEDLEEFNSPLILDNMHGFERELQEIVKLYTTPNLFHSELAGAQFKLFLCRLAGKMAYELSEVHGIVDSALEYIKEHFCDGITNADVAAYVGYHSYYLNRLMVSKTGKTIHLHIMDRRLEYACELLILNDLSVNDISRRCGFGNVTHFCNFFKQRTGQSPTAFRKRFAHKL